MVVRFFHIQLHPGVPAKSVEYAVNCLKHVKAIGRNIPDHKILHHRRLRHQPLTKLLDDDCNQIMEKKKAEARHLMNLRDLRRGDIGLVRGGTTPVALVKINAPAVWAERDDPWGWYEYRWPVRILGWYDEDKDRWQDIEFKAPGPKTFQLLTGVSNVKDGIKRWLAH
jgi:hypothetical protein